MSKEISVFLELAKAFSGQKDLFVLLELIKDRATSLMESDRCSIFLVDKETNDLWALMADGVNVIRFPYGKGVVGSVIENNEILNIKDAKKDHRFYKEIDKQTGYSTKNILCVPMRNRFGKAVGAIEVLNKSNGVFTKHDENLLMILGTQAAMAIENVEMLEDVQESLKQLNVLNLIQRKANYIVDINAVLEMIFREITGTLRGGIYIITRFHSSGTPVCSCYVPPGEFRTFYAGDNKFKKWAEKHHGLEDIFNIIPDRLEQLKSKDMFTLSGGAVAAIKDQGKLDGYIEIRALQQDDRLFNRRAMDFLKVVAGQIMSFIENRLLVEEKGRAEKMAVVGTMVSTIVHDIKNPLSGISGYAQLIQRRTKDDNIKKFTGIMLEELERLENMNNELLTFVRGKELELDICEVSAEYFINEIVRIIGPDFEKNGIELVLSKDGTGTIAIDRSRMKRVFVNIANNARDAMPEGGRFYIKSVSTDNFIKIELRDNGKGMPPAVRARLFEPFFTHGKNNGTGLGMAIAGNIIEKHGGTITVESEQGKGTAFIISLPIQNKESL